MTTAILLILYFVPTLIVIVNDKKVSKAPTIVINVLLGWTLIGWVAALAMSVGQD